MATKKRFEVDLTTPLPADLDPATIRKAVEHIEEQSAEWIDIYYEQSNVFSAIVGILGTKALSSLSRWEKHKHPDTSMQRFPDLRRRGAKLPLSPNDSLESKGSKRPWEVQSHYDHPGWYIIWRYLVDETEMIERGKPVIVWRVDVVFLEKSDWKYEGSTASEDGGGRTHTYGVKRPAAKLKGKAAVYRRTDIELRGGKPVLKVSVDEAAVDATG
jgi:hypothetical protein